MELRRETKKEKAVTKPALRSATGKSKKSIATPSGRKTTSSKTRLQASKRKSVGLETKSKERSQRMTPNTGATNKEFNKRMNPTTH